MLRIQPFLITCTGTRSAIRQSYLVFGTYRLIAEHVGHIPRVVAHLAAGIAVTVTK